MATWVLDSTTATDVAWRRNEDGYVIGFNRKGIGEPWSAEDAPPAEIDKLAPPIATPDPQDRFTTLETKVAALEAENATLKLTVAKHETDITDLKPKLP